MENEPRSDEEQAGVDHSVECVVEYPGPRRPSPTVASSALHVIGAAHTEGETSARTRSVWMRRHLPDSIYIWACNERADDEDDDPMLSDKLIAWLILIMQGFAYTMLVVLTGRTHTSDTRISAEGDSGEPDHLLPSVTGAMYLLVTSTMHDLRAGHSLLVDGSSTSHRAFGVGLLLVFGIMITATMTVLVSMSDSSASVVLNAVTVIFIADLDEKALKFLKTVPQKWRLFWAIESIGISFALGLVAIIEVGDSSPLMEGSDGPYPIAFTTCFVWGLNPLSVTIVSYLLSSSVQAFCDLWNEAYDGEDEPTFSSVVRKAFGSIFAAVKKARERSRLEPCFYGILCVWLAQIVPNWLDCMRGDGFPLAVMFVPNAPTSEQGHFEITPDKSHLLCMTAVLTTGLAAKAGGVCVRTGSAPTCDLERVGPRQRPGRLADSRVPSLLVGWGVGYWALSLLHVLGCSWHGSGWNNAPNVVSLIGYTLVPLFLFTGIFMVADINFLGTRFGAFVKPAVEILNNRHSVEYWVVVTIFRDSLVVWVMYCDMMTCILSYWR